MENRFVKNKAWQVLIGLLLVAFGASSLFAFGLRSKKPVSVSSDDDIAVSAPYDVQHVISLSKEDGDLAVRQMKRQEENPTTLTGFDSRPEVVEQYEKKSFKQQMKESLGDAEDRVRSTVGDVRKRAEDAASFVTQPVANRVGQVTTKAGQAVDVVKTQAQEVGARANRRMSQLVDGDLKDADDNLAEKKDAAARARQALFGTGDSDNAVAAKNLENQKKGIFETVTQVPRKGAEALRSKAGDAAGFALGKARSVRKGVTSVPGRVRNRLMGEAPLGEKDLDKLQNDPEKLKAAYEKIVEAALDKQAAGVPLSFLEKDALMIRQGASVELINQKRQIDNEVEKAALNTNKLRGELQLMDRNDEATFKAKSEEVNEADKAYGELMQKMIIVGAEIKKQIVEKKIQDGLATVKEIRDNEYDTATRTLEREIYDRFNDPNPSKETLTAIEDARGEAIKVLKAQNITEDEESIKKESIRTAMLNAKKEKGAVVKSGLEAKWKAEDDAAAAAKQQAERAEVGSSVMQIGSDDKADGQVLSVQSRQSGVFDTGLTQ